MGERTMSFHSWLQKLRNALAGGQGQRDPRRRSPRSATPRSATPRSATPRSATPRPATHRLNLEPLEERRLPAFLAPVDYAAGSAPGAIVSADFNNDGAADLAVLNSGSNAVSVLLGNMDA